MRCEKNPNKTRKLIMRKSLNDHFAFYCLHRYVYFNFHAFMRVLESIAQKMQSMQMQIHIPT